MEITYQEVDEELKTEYAKISQSNAHTFIKIVPDYFSLAALHESCPVALIVCKKRPLAAPVDDCIEAFIDVIEVDQEYQRRGIATELLYRAETWARGFGARQMHAWSEEIRVEALSLWKKSGYTFSKVDFTRGDEKRYGFHVCKLLI